MRIPITMFVAVAAISTFVFAGEPVNKNCPFTGNPASPDVTLTIGEDTVAFCCTGCLNGFKKWTPEKQLTYIAEQKGTSVAPVETAVIEYVVHTPYLLDTCPITGKRLGSMGDPIIEIIDGREVRFCCAGCPPKFKENKAEMFAKIDKQMIADQMPYYPLKTCVVSGDRLQAGNSVDFIYGNRLFRVSNSKSYKAFMADPAKYIPEIDEAIIKTQVKEYGLTTCVIRKGPLDGMGSPYQMIVGNRLVQLCCAGCRPKVLKDPLAVFAMIDEAKK